MPKNWITKIVDTDAKGEQYKYKYPRSRDFLVDFVDYQIANIGNLGDAVPPEAGTRIMQRIVASLVNAVRKGEGKLQQEFGGANPESNQFGAQVLRPLVFYTTASANYVGQNNNTRFIWTSGGSASVAWAAEDTMLNVTLDKDEYALLTGYFNNDAIPNTTELFIQPGTSKLAPINVEYMRAMGRKHIWFDPILVEPSGILKVLAAVKTTSLAEEAGFMGYFLAPASKLIRETH